MQTLDVLQKRIRTTGDLLSVVKTMKSLAAVNIRHFERAARSLEEYAEVVEQGWSVLLRSEGLMLPLESEQEGVILTVGSDQGMCGQFNELAVSSAIEVGKRLRKSGMNILFWSAGDRARAGLEDAGQRPILHFSMPGTLGGVDGVVQELVENMAQWKQRGTGRFHVVHNAQSDPQPYDPVETRILPLDRKWGRNLARKEWPGRCIPQTFIPGEMMFSGLFSQHMFVSLYGALARSLAAENSARLSAMQAAEKNIEEMRYGLQGEFRQTRQNAITDELLDIVAGFEALA